MARSSCVLHISRATVAARSRRDRYIVFRECFVESAAAPQNGLRLIFGNQFVGCGTRRTSLVQSLKRGAILMLYAILAYHVEAEVMSWTPEQDAALMTDLMQVRERLMQEDRLGPSARLGETGKACTLRGPGNGMVIDGPFAETKEQLLGLYMIDCVSRDAAIEAARDLRRVNPSAVYEIRPIRLYLPGVAFPETAAD
jgi:hypothetical protein